MTTLQPITVNRIQYIGAYSKSKHHSTLRINKNEVLSPLATFTSESIKVKKTYHQKNISKTMMLFIGLVIVSGKKVRI